MTYSDLRRPPQESCLQDEAQVFGRQAEIGVIVETLLSDDDGGRDLPVVSITGHGGIGKTVVARKVFDNSLVKDCFKMRIWVGLEQGFDVMKTTEEIVRSIEKKECCFSSFSLLQYHLKKIVGRKRFLLVLDNVWNEHMLFWESLFAPLVGSAKGSKILITTRSEMVSRNTQAMFSSPLKSLANEDSWTLFCSRAFPGIQLQEVSESYSHLEETGKVIVGKCQGFPLAVKLIGALLYNERDALLDNERGALLYNERDEDKWARVLDEMPEIEAVEQTVVPTLKVSYDCLPLQLKHCFAFCSVFPSGYGFDKDELIKLWMALGLIKPRGRTRLENIGDDYFSGLMRRSFFHMSDGYASDKQKYKMPSILHDLAKSVSVDCLRMDHNGVQNVESKMARYAFLHQYDGALESECLRALILHDQNKQLSKQLLCNLFKKVRYLRVLDLSYCLVDELPDSFGDLILLRYVNLYSTRITTLPESVGNLYNLQSLELGNCHELEKLPDSIGDLKHLRYLGLHSTKLKRLPESVARLANLHTLELGECGQLLDLPKGLSNLTQLRHLGLHLDWEVRDRTDLISMPLGIGKLTSLQTLSRFVVGSKSGGGIGELRNLNLRGELCISKLENVVSESDAVAAKLKDKRRIDSLMLRWSDGTRSSSRNSANEEGVIKCLCPHENLGHLWIDNYKGNRFPDWMEDPRFKILETLRLSNCRECIALPYVGKLPHLRTLRVEGLHKVEIMDYAFSGGEDAMGCPHLERLSLIDMPNLQKFEVIRGDMACLSELTISNCSNLRELPYLPPTVMKLEIRDCLQLTVFPDIQFLQDLVIEGGGAGIVEWIQQGTSLSSLTISKFPLRDPLPKGLISLTKLKIQECHLFVSLDQHECLQNLTSLELLEISSCPCFSFSPDERLPTNLKELRLVSCKSLQSLPVPLPSLQSLTITKSPILQNWCHKDGADWLKGIADLEIDPVEPTPWTTSIKKVAAGFKLGFTYK